MNYIINPEKTIYTVYVLFSNVHGKRYVGYTLDLLGRFTSHNELSKKGWTRRYRPRKVVYCEYFESKTEAIEREKYLKSGIGRDYLDSIFKM